ncbi:hypothetical protein GCM10010168_04130 [Actinoplanes ianthinogenes]|uniref:DUF4328 domain-containing protein n=1 Tax=Actinoplanes ianthinogenes TaxID=122358 RepID=A0ABM7LUC9_9ACTN|nr:DUF4328 domain-containing protein [Actinoplanes ianthinogenes]BCJ42847.1 hypothetical protein Aiant_35040 [Actinoplanes ianthinogenes]GGQ91808.1 hypothetical protein GCM10010168_04130 [Actinoplanes ianthinogenes]
MSAQQPPPVPDDSRPESLTPPADPWSAEASTETWPSATLPPAPPAPPPAPPAAQAAPAQPASAYPTSAPPPAYADPTAPPAYPGPASASPAPTAPPAYPGSAAASPAPTAPPAYPAPAPAYPAYPAPAPPGYPAPASGPPGYPAPASAYPAPVSAYAVPPGAGVPPAPYAYPPAYAPGYARSLRGPAILAGTGLALTMVYSLVLELLTRSLPVGTDNGLIAVFLGYLGVFLFTVVTFLVWLHRASTNLWNTGHRLKWRPGWAIGAWFIPLANLVLPLLVFREIDQQSRDHGPGLFVTWAAAWTIGIVVDGYASNGAEQFSGLSLITTPVAAVAAILLIRRITTDQQRLVQPTPF